MIDTDQKDSYSLLNSFNLFLPLAEKGIRRIFKVYLASKSPMVVLVDILYRILFCHVPRS